MILELKKTTSEKTLNEIENCLRDLNITFKYNLSDDYLIMALLDNAEKASKEQLAKFKEIINIKPYSSNLKLSSREAHPRDTIVKVKGISIGNNCPFIFIAGPCSVESFESLEKIAQGVKKAECNFLRGGAFKPRTSPYTFQGLGNEGIEYLQMVSQETSLPIVSEITSIQEIPFFLDKVDIIQVGARNMQNYELLKALGKIHKPILLKRGLSASVEEWLLASEYILKEGNEEVILCERGIRTFETVTRNTLDLSAVALVKQISHLPVIVDPSHATGLKSLIKPMTLASVMANADGVMIECHYNPNEAISDGEQSLDLTQLEDVVKSTKKLIQGWKQ